MLCLLRSFIKFRRIKRKLKKKLQMFHYSIAHIIVSRWSCESDQTAGFAKYDMQEFNMTYVFLFRCQQLPQSCRLVSQANFNSRRRALPYFQRRKCVIKFVKTMMIQLVYFADTYSICIYFSFYLLCFICLNFQEYESPRKILLTHIPENGTQGHLATLQ